MSKAIEAPNLILVLYFPGVRQCRSTMAAWCGPCTEAVPPIKSNCALHGRFPHPKNCSLFIECSGSGSTSYACVCSCANKTMIFNSHLGVCVPSLNSSAGATKTNDCTILETHLNLLDGSKLHTRNSTSKGSATLTPFKEGSIPGKERSTPPQPSTTLRTDSEKPKVATGSIVGNAGNRRNTKWWKRKKGVIIHDNPTVPTWVVALLVFLGVLVMLVVVLSLYH